MNHLLIVSEEFLARIHVGLGEIAAKFSVPVLNEIEKLVTLAKEDEKSFVAMVEAHIAPVKAKLAAIEAMPKDIVAADVESAG